MTYIMTWKTYAKFGFGGYSLCRERIWPFSMRRLSFDTPLGLFLYLSSAKRVGSKDFRLTRCGKLVARSATYLGV